MSKNVAGADNQQGSPLIYKLVNYDPSETTRRAPFSKKEIVEIRNIKKKDGDIVHALWRHREQT